MITIVYLLILFITIGCIIYYFRQATYNLFNIDFDLLNEIKLSARDTISDKWNKITSLPDTITTATIKNIKEQIKYLPMSMKKEIIDAMLENDPNHELVPKCVQDNISYPVHLDSKLVSGDDLPWDAEYSYCERKPTRTMRIDDMYKKTYNFEPDVIMY